MRISLPYSVNNFQERSNDLDLLFGNFVTIGEMESARRNVLLIVIFINLLASVLSNQIFSIHAGGGGFGRSSHEPKYKIEFHEPHSPFHPDDDQESMVMSDKNGQKFSCFLPKEDKAKTSKFFTLQNTSSLIVETQRKVTLKTPDELLEVFKDKCLYRQEGWWSYEFCYQKNFRQLHLEGDKVVQEFILGVYDEEATTTFNQNLSDVSILKDPRSKDASQRYHAHQYTNGTSCDLTNRPRETEVRFVCSEPNAVIASITELSTCKYALTLHSPMLCKHPMYKEQRPVWRTVNCNKISKDSKPMGTEDGSSKDKQITMVTDVKVPSSHG